MSPRVLQNLVTILPGGAIGYFGSALFLNADLEGDALIWGGIGSVIGFAYALSEQKKKQKT